MPSCLQLGVGATPYCPFCTSWSSQIGEKILLFEQQKTPVVPEGFRMADSGSQHKLPQDGRYRPLSFVVMVICGRVMRGTERILVVASQASPLLEGRVPFFRRQSDCPRPWLFVSPRSFIDLELNIVILRLLCDSALLVLKNLGKFDWVSALRPAR